MTFMSSDYHNSFLLCRKKSCSYFQSMTVAGYNHVFATAVGPGEAPYGLASGCFSDPACRHADFSVNLTGTGFIVDPDVSRFYMYNVSTF